eukprot:3942137-Pyramimonas_sp.AAC.1
MFLKVPILLVTTPLASRPRTAWPLSRSAPGTGAVLPRSRFDPAPPATSCWPRRSTRALGCVNGQPPRGLTHARGSRRAMPGCWGRRRER